MGNSSRQKTGPRTISCGANNNQNNTSSQNARDFSPRADLEAQITASPSPVTSAKDARSWLKNKGWILNSEGNSASKLSDILLSVTLSFKLPANANTTIRAVAFLLRDHTDETLASTITDCIIDKVIDRISDPLTRLNDTVISMPQLCAYIFAILFEFSGIFNWRFPLNILYFRRKHCLINRMRAYSLRHQFTMRPPHACYVIRACDGRSDCKCRFRSTCTPALPSQFQNALDQSESRMSPSRSAETSWARHLHNNGPFHHITDASCQKYYYIWIESFAIGSFFILKFRLTL